MYNAIFLKSVIEEDLPLSVIIYLMPSIQIIIKLWTIFALYPMF